MTLVKYRNGFDDYVPSSFSSVIDNFFNDGLNRTASPKSFSPKVDIVETDKGYEVNLAVPGLKKEDFSIELNENLLTISGERKFVNEDKGKNYLSVESQYGSFTRSFRLPKNVKGEKIEARYEAGILGLFIPKDEKKALKSTIAVK